jgi:AcrR family transcriptional regulator
MAQRQKNEVRRAIVDAAAAEFAAVGLGRATLASIAEKAGTSIGNLYKYFANKDELFRAAIPDEVAEKLSTLLRRRVEALHGERDVNRLEAGHPHRVVSEDLFQFALAHRARIIFLLRRAEGTPFEGFAEESVKTLAKLAVAYGRDTYPRASITAARRRALDRVYRAFLMSLCSILDEEAAEDSLRAAVGDFSTYHLAGLRGFFEAAEK